MSKNISTIRHQGVRAPVQQASTDETPLTVTQVSRGQLLLIEYVDERSRKCSELVLAFGNKVFVQPDEGRWTASFRPMNSKISAQVYSKLEELQASEAREQANEDPVVPPQDAVDITPETK